MNNDSNLLIESPCIRNCCLNDEDICVGCFRTLEEILQWGAATPDQKRHILNCVKNRKPSYTSSR
ncbi:DUF1289 domain-containing protein [Aliiglaciecola litoralis]|uniref:DUF1289 domain-containing protein n=1 Tax=Aliiglaciecola litoralis TaxID=582857 RepID=UPI0031D38543